MTFQAGRPAPPWASGGGWPRGGLARRAVWTPSLFPLSPREFFSASPFELMRRFSEEMDRAFEDFGLARDWGFSGGATTLWSPAVEVFERDNNFVVRADLPGLNKDDVKVEMTDEGLVIQGERKREHEEKGEGWYRSERSYGQFYRLIPLPEGTNAEQAKAQFENGVLEVSVPVPESQRRRRIPIETSGGQTQRTQTASSGSGNK
jgi:HSP20 family protein